MKHSPRLVAAIKAARRAGLSLKLVSRLSGVPCPTIKAYTHKGLRRSVMPDPGFHTRLEHFGRRLFL